MIERSLNYLDRVYFNIYSLIEPKLFKNKKLFIIFTNNYLKYIEVQLLLDKEQVFKIIKDFKI